MIKIRYSYGIKVAERAGLQASILLEAEETARSLEAFLNVKRATSNTLSSSLTKSNNALLSQIFSLLENSNNKTILLLLQAQAKKLLQSIK